MKNPKNVSAGCATCEIWLTALFDGQATADEMQAARAHLKNCVSCKRVWREWSRTRSLLRATPLPTPPATLADRVLLTCRLMPSLDAPAQSALEQSIAREEVARYLNATDLEYSNAFAPAPLSAFFKDAAAPADLKHKILQATVQAKNAPAKSKLPRIFAPHIFLLGLQSWTETVRAWNAPRWGFALAVPATAVWILMAGGSSDYTNLTSTSTPTSALSTLQSSPRTSSVMSAPSFLPKWVTEKTTVKSSLPKIATAGTRPTAAPSRSVELLEVKEVSTDEDSLNRDFQPRFASTEIASPISNGDVFGSTPDNRTKPSTAVKPMPKTNLPRIVRKPSIGFIQRPRNLMRVTFSNASGTFRRLSSNGGRNVSTLDTVELREPAPSTPDPNFNETLVSVARTNDDRPEDLGAALDQYRASLLKENIIDDEDEFEDEVPSDEL